MRAGAQVTLLNREGGDSCDVRRTLLPGYGFAFAHPERVEAWNRLMDKYLTGRTNLKRVYVVIDARHGLKVGRCRLTPG